MTQAEYGALYDEYWKSDSIKRREDIEEKIEKAAVALFNQVRDIFDKYHARKDLIWNDEYRDDRGWIGLAHEDDGEPIIENDSILLRYRDRWAYGGECSIGILVYAKWFDPEERKKLAEELRKKRIEKLDAAIEGIKKEISYKEEQLQKCIGEFNTLKAGGDPDNIEDIEN